MGEDEDGEGNGDGQDTRIHARGAALLIGGDGAQLVGGDGVQLVGGDGGHCVDGPAEERDDDHAEKVAELSDGVEDADDHPGRQEARVLERN